MLLIADNLQITRPQIHEAVRDQKPEPLQSLARAMEAAGANAIDLNTGPLTRDPAAHMAFCIQTLQDVTDLPLLIDTSNPVAIQAGLEANRKTVIINGISLEPAKLEKILPLAVRYDVAVIGYLLDRHSHPPREPDDRLAIALSLFEHGTRAGLRQEQLVIDPVVAPLIWQDGLQRNRDLLDIVARLPELLGFPVRTVAGLSNLTTGQGSPRHKRLLEQAFVPMLASAGLSWLLLNIHHQGAVATAKACNSLLEDTIFAWDALTDRRPFFG